MKILDGISMPWQKLNITNKDIEKLGFSKQFIVAGYNERWIKKIISFIILAFLPFFISAQVTDIEKFNKNIEEALKGKVVGATWAIAQNGTVVKTGAIGYARTSLDLPELKQSADIRQNPASVAKTITAVAILQLLKEKNIPLQSSIKDYLPKTWVRGKGVDNVTFTELLTHTSGLYKGSKNGAWSTSYIKDRIAEDVGSKAPNYANCNFSLLRILAAYILKGAPADENIAGINKHAADGLAGYIATKIMAPLGINNFTTKPSTAYAMPLFYHTDKYKGTTEYGTEADDWGDSYGGAGYYISAKELAVFLAALENGKILSKDQLKFMKSFQLGMGWWYKP
jgi:CubicO group peptidase (beta-lactamase class C family)